MTTDPAAIREQLIERARDLLGFYYDQHEVSCGCDICIWCDEYDKATA